MLTDAVHKKDKPSPKTKSIVAKTGHQWSDKQKLDAVNAYLLLGNVALVSRTLAIPEDTLRYWRRSAWWADLVAEQKAAEKLQLSSRIRRLVDASLAVVTDRLEHADAVYDSKTGQVVRKPVSMKDAHRVAMDLQARGDILDKVLTQETVTDEKVGDKLEALAEKFAEMATKKLQQHQDTTRTVDIEDVVEIKQT